MDNELKLTPIPAGYQSSLLALNDLLREQIHRAICGMCDEAIKVLGVKNG